MIYPFKVTLDRSRWHELTDIIEWCWDTFGDGGHESYGDKVWTLETAFGNSIFSFHNPVDAEFFALKWK